MLRKLGKFVSESFWFILLLFFAAGIYLMFLPETIMRNRKP